MTATLARFGLSFALAAAAAATTVGSQAPVALPPADKAPEVADLGGRLERIRGESKVPGMAIAVIGTFDPAAPPRLLGRGRAGVREAGTDRAIASDDLWHLGSCTKAFTATLCAILVDEGKLRWDATVADALRNDSASIDRGWAEVTLEDLLRHTGGAPPTAPTEAWRAAWACGDEAVRCRQRFVEAILAAPPQARGTFRYSNQGYSIAGRMCELAAGAPWEELVTRRVCEPLGIASAGFGVPSKHRPDRAPKGHDEHGAVSDIDNPNAIAPAGTLHMTIEDWARFVAFHAAPSPSSALPITQASFDRLHRAAANSTSGAALGWMAAERPWGGPVLNHSGSNTVWFCTTWISPSKRFAVLVTANQGGDAAARAADRAAASAIEWWQSLAPRETSPVGAPPDESKDRAPTGASPES